jgi:hypothetical protein
MSFTVDGTSGLTFPNSTTQASAGSMTLLGTVTATSGNSVSLGSLTLTGYKSLQIVMQSVTGLGALYITSDNSQTASYQAPFQMVTSQPCSGINTISLGNGAFFGGSGQDSANNPNYGGGKTNITTSSTTIYFRLASTNTFSGSGSFLVYGII